MEFERISIEGLAVVTLSVFGDERGFFAERYRASEFARHGLPTEFMQDNHSRSNPGVLRGIHYQSHPAQGKLVGATRGRVWDVAVDLRSGSPTFGKSFGVELSGANGKLLWMPPGFGHGFCVIGDEPADVVYKATAEYNAATDSGIIWNDPDLAIDWPVSDPSLSERDKKLQTFAEYRQDPIEWSK